MPKKGEAMYSPRIERALTLALRVHSGQVRKGNPDAPYAVHVVHVALMLRQTGFDEDIMIAGLLHDAVEDRGCSLEVIGDSFGDTVTGIVREVTEDKSLVWEERKIRYVRHLSEASEGAKAVCAADKIHNLYNILEGLEAGRDVWQSFKRGREKSLWFYESVLDALRSEWKHPILDTYAEVVRRVKEYGASDLRA